MLCIQKKNTYVHYYPQLFYISINNTPSTHDTFKTCKSSLLTESLSFPMSAMFTKYSQMYVNMRVPCVTWLKGVALQHLIG